MQRRAVLDIDQRKREAMEKAKKALPTTGTPLMSTHASILVDSVGPPSAEVCRTAANFP
jgi:hypothetical protein